MARRMRARNRDDAARFLARVYCEPETAAHVIQGTRELYAAVQRIRRADLPREALAIVGEIEALTIAYGQWLRDAGLGRQVFGDKR